MKFSYLLKKMISFLSQNINNSNLSKFLEMSMLPKQNTEWKKETLTTPPSKKLLSPKSLTRKPNWLNFTKKKTNEPSETKDLDRVKFISPSKTNFLINQETSVVRDSFNMTQIRQDPFQTINYPYIKKCVSPKNSGSFSQSRKVNEDSTLKDESSIFGDILTPSIEDISNCQILEQGNHKKYSQQISQLRKQNFELNLLLDEKNTLLDKQKSYYIVKVSQLQKQLFALKEQMTIAEKRVNETQKKLVESEKKFKELEMKYDENTEKLEKAQKQIKMYKAKYRINFSHVPSQNSRSKRYHQNCCKTQIYNQNNPINKNKCYRKMSDHQQSKQSAQPLGEWKNIETPKKKSRSKDRQALKKIKSENVLTSLKTISSNNLQSCAQGNMLMKVHNNQEEFKDFCQMKHQIQELNQQIRYKDIEISVLKKAKCQFENDFKTFQKTKQFNRKLLARVQFLTREAQHATNFQKSQQTPRNKSKFKKQTFFEDFSCSSSEQENFQLQLSPQKFNQDADTERDSVVQVQN